MDHEQRRGSTEEPFGGKNSEAQNALRKAIHLAAEKNRDINQPTEKGRFVYPYEFLDQPRTTLVIELEEALRDLGYVIARKNDT